ncbi:guanylate-binding protein 1-like [Acipenser ruthenus]|uniref:guanylate-binding protein 1-like n=1 Tax=Acipenser ruthenus TaxID=7906 RepID=UPI0027420A8C|nr:guanylate-binding protein 1-like [Acipenser ruthenus]
MLPEEIIGKPIPLIENTRGNERQVQQEALDILKSIQQHVVVVCIAGRYRTGKSYLMNRLASKKTGFPLGSTIQSKTKGIWMMCVHHPKRENTTLVLLDTEGLGDVEKGDQKNDDWIFILAILLSSTLVYNSVGTIDNDAIQKLHYVTELSKRIKTKAADGEDKDDSINFVGFFPSFVWALRDFSLELELNGENITADKYLENSLVIKQENAADSNVPRECIRKFFPKRKCFVFESPGTSKLLKKIESIPDSELEPDFVQQSNEFSEHIFDTAKIKEIKEGIPLTGSLFGALVNKYVEVIRSGKMLVVENAVKELAKIENEAAEQAAFSYYKENIAKIPLPTDTAEGLSVLHGKWEKEALGMFNKRSFEDENGQHQIQLGKSILDHYESVCRKNEEASRSRCQALIKELSEDMKKKQSGGYYMKPGGYELFKKDKEDIEKQYRDKPGKGIQADIILKDFLEDTERTGKAVLVADNTLTEKQKQFEEEQARRKASEQQEQVIQEQKKQLEQMVKDQIRSHQEHVDQMLKKAEEEKKNFIAEKEKIIAHHQKERERLLKEKNDEMARKLEEQNKKVKQQKQEFPLACAIMKMVGDIVSAGLNTRRY